MASIVNLQNISWIRRGKYILHKIDWQINKDEHWAILGLNGSGKTTLLNMINGYIWPSEGEVEVLNEKFGQTNIHKLRQRIGWVSSSLAERIYNRTKSEDLIISGKYASVGRFDTPTKQDYDRAKKIMQELKIEYLFGRFYELCSQGEKQKILIGRALMANPELLILDEPTNGLDFLAKEELLETIGNIIKQKNSPTIIFVTHHIDEIIPEISHTLLLENGTVLNQGKTNHILTDENLSQLFKTAVSLEWKDNRAWLQRNDS